MSCILTTEELVAYLDGVADEQVLNHIETCTVCQRKARELGRAQERFDAKLFGHTCLTAMKLGEYHLRTLPTREAQRIRSHLRQCRKCRQQLNELQDFVDHDSLFDFMVRQPLLTIVYPYIAAMSGHSANMAYAVRGGEENQDITYKIQESEINIQIQDSDSKLDHKTIWGLIVGLEADEILSAELKPLDQTQASTMQEIEAGMFTIEDIPPGEYDLQLNRSDSAILLRDLQV